MIRSKTSKEGRSKKARRPARPPIARKDMGTHPAYGHRVPNGTTPARDEREEDYGSRGLRRQAGTAKAESLRSRGADPESVETERKTDKPAARKGRRVARSQSSAERDANRRVTARRR